MRCHLSWWWRCRRFSFMNPGSASPLPPPARSKEFGGGLFALAASVVADLIHHDPLVYRTLDDAGLPQVRLTSISIPQIQRSTVRNMDTKVCRTLGDAGLPQVWVVGWHTGKFADCDQGFSTRHKPGVQTVINASGLLHGSTMRACPRCGWFGWVAWAAWAGRFPCPGGWAVAPACLRPYPLGCPGRAAPSKRGQQSWGTVGAWWCRRRCCTPLLCVPSVWPLCEPRPAAAAASGLSGQRASLTMTDRSTDCNQQTILLID